MAVSQAKVSLVRGLGLVSAASIVISNVIGQGIFLKTRVMVCNVMSPGLVISVWIAAGLLSLAGALTYAELAAMMPRAGGEYVFVREAYGRRMGFFYGWMQLLIAKTGSQAALAVGFAIFLNALLGGALDVTLFEVPFPGFTVRIGYLQIVAVGIIALVTLINFSTVAASGRIATVLTIVKIGLVVLIAFGAFFLASGSWGNFISTAAGTGCEDVSAAARGGIAGFGAAMLGALWAYDGWNNLTLVAGEVSHPQRNIPAALFAGMVTIFGLYALANLAYFYVLSPAQIASLPASASIATEVATRFLGPFAVALMSAGLMISTFGTLHTSILAGSRIPYAMAEDKQLPAGLSWLSNKSHVPVRALILQAVWAILLALSGSYDTLTDYVIFGSWIFYGLTAGSVFIFRRRLPEAERPYRTWGYPVVPVLFLVTTTLLLINTLVTAPLQSLTGLFLIALGLPAYALINRQKRI